MRLTNLMRTEISSAMVKKYFSDEKYKSLASKVLKDLKKDEYIKKRKALFERYPEFIYNSDYVTIRSKELSIVQNLSLDFKIAVRVQSRWQDVEIYIEDHPVIKESGYTFLKFLREKHEFRCKLAELLATVNSTSKLEEVLPEAMEFLPEGSEEGVITDSDLKYVRNSLSKPR